MGRLFTTECTYLPTLTVRTSRGLHFDATYACTGMHNSSNSCCFYLI